MDKMIRERISSLFLFHEMHFEELDAKYHVMEKVIIQKYCAGEILLSARENPVGLAILLDGSAQILSGDEKHPALLRTMGAGDSLGPLPSFPAKKDTEPVCVPWKIAEFCTCPLSWWKKFVSMSRWRPATTLSFSPVAFPS